METHFLTSLHQIIKTGGGIEQVTMKIADFCRNIVNGNLSIVTIPEFSPKSIFYSTSDNVPLSSKTTEALHYWFKQNNQKTNVFEKAYQKLPLNNFPLISKQPLEAFLIIPLIIDNQTRGVLSILHTEPHFYTEDEIIAIETTAGFLETAICNFILSEEKQQKAVQLENLYQISQLLISGGYLEEILTFIAGTVVETMKVQVCSIILANEERQIFYFKALACPDKSYHQSVSTPIHHYVCGQTYFSRNPTYVPNIKLEKNFATPDLAKKYDLHSMLSVPMTCQAKIIGVFNIYTTELHRFKEEEIHLLQLIANQVASVVHETYLTKEITKTRRDLIAQKKLQRAKSIIMKKYQLSEDEAHRLILRRSMELRKPILEIAENILNSQVIE